MFCQDLSCTDYSHAVLALLGEPQCMVNIYMDQQHHSVYPICVPALLATCFPLIYVPRESLDEVDGLYGL